MKTPSNPCSKHSSSIPQAMLGGCPMLCLMRARRCLCVLRTPDFGLRTSYFGLRSRFPIFVFKFVCKTISLSFHHDERESQQSKSRKSWGVVL